jgi:hypothetical protein
MSVVKFLQQVSKSLVISAAALLVSGVAMSSAAQAHEVCVTVHSVVALDKIDVSPADFYARVEINGIVDVTKRIKQKNAITPNWVICQDVGKRKTVSMVLEIWDKDIAADDMIDINPITSPKRRQNFGVNTRTCRVSGFSSGPKCKTKITQSGNEKKKATVVFSVNVK